MKTRKLLLCVLAAVLIICNCSGCNRGQSVESNPDTQSKNETKVTTSAPADTTQTDAETTADTTVESTTGTTVKETEAPTTETTVKETEAPTTETTAETTEQPTQAETQVQTTPPAVSNPFTPTPLTGALPESGSVDASYFNDAVFIGDSVSLKLSYYEAAVDKLGTAQFLTSGSLGSGNALWKVSDDSVHPTYEGTKMLLEESVPLTGAKKMYIMLGMNDIALYGIDGAVTNMVTLIQNIQAAAPGITVYVQSMTPITNTSDLLSESGHNPQNIHRYNETLAATCQSKGWKFVNVAEVMYDENGYLRREYCSDPDDMGIHFTEAGCEAWISYLYTHAG